MRILSNVRQNLHERILDSAELLFAQFGFHKVTMEEIARQADVARATIYLHFADKKEIGLACADRMHLRLLAHLRQIAAQPAPAVTRLRHMLVGRVLFAFDAAQDVSVKFDDMFAAIKPLYMVRREQYFENEAHLFREVLKAGVRSGEIAVQDGHGTALALVLATNALMPFSLSPRQLKARSEVKRKASKITDLLLKGMLPSRRSSGASKPSRRASLMRKG